MRFVVWMWVVVCDVAGDGKPIVVVVVPFTAGLVGDDGRARGV